MQSLVSFLLFTASLGLAWRLPRSVPYLVIVGAVILVPGGRYSSEVPILVGAMFGTALRLMQAGGWRVLVPRGWKSALPLFALSAATLLSWVVNASAQEGALATDLSVATRWFVLRLLVLATLVVWERWQFDDLLMPLLTAAGFLVVVRIGQAFNVSLAQSLANDLALLSDAHNVGAFNLFAGFITLLVPAVLVKATESDDSRAWIWRGIGLGLVWTLASTASRTGALVLVSQCVLLVVILRTWRQRLWIGVMLGFFIALGVGTGYLSNKSVYEAVAVPAHLERRAPVAVTAPSGEVTPPPSGTVAAGADSAPPGNPVAPPPAPSKPGVDWRSLLWRPEVQVVQTVTLDRARADATIYMAVRRGFESSIKGVDVLVDGVLVSTVPANAISDRELDWVKVPLQKTALDGKNSVQIALRLAGKGDMVRDYVEIGGVHAKAHSYNSSFANGKASFETDLSPDPGLQTGSFQIFLGEKEPSDLIALPPEQAEKALSTSLSDRLVLWRAALRNFSDNPFTGTGLYTFRNVYTRYLDEPMFEEYANSHNMYLQMLSDTGLLGALAFLPILLGPVLLMVRRLVLVLLRRGDRSSTAEWLPGLSLLSVVLTSTMHVWIADVRYYVPALLVATLAGASELSRTRSSALSHG